MTSAMQSPKNGIRNALLTSIAPTGTISLYAGKRIIRYRTQYSPTPTHAKYCKKTVRAQKKRSLITPCNCGAKNSATKSVAKLLRKRPNIGAAGTRPHASSCAKMGRQFNFPKRLTAPKTSVLKISKRSTCPLGIRAVRAVQHTARTTSTGSVLSVAEDSTQSPPEVDTGADVVYLAEPLDRPNSLEGHTYKLKWPETEHAMYITINDVIMNGSRRPFEGVREFQKHGNTTHGHWP